MKSNGKILNESRVLCVDDDPASLEMLRTILVQQGAHVTTCMSAEEAIAALANERFDVVVSDLSMPGLDGYDLMHSLREMENQDSTRHETSTIAVSGDAMRPARKRRYADFQVYMPKPVNMARLVYVVKRLREADGEVVELGSLGSWEAEQAIEAAASSTMVAATATAAAAEAVAAAADATAAAVDATAAAAKAKETASEAERNASEAAAKAPLKY